MTTLLRILGAVLGAVVGMFVIAVVAVGIKSCIRYDKDHPRTPLNWHGMASAPPATCHPDIDDIWPPARTNCISVGVMYTCILNSRMWMYECAAGFSAEK